MGREKFVDLPLPELYALTADPGEKQNLVDGRPDRRRLLAASLRQLGAGTTAARRQEDAATTERLKSLGYVSGGTAPHSGPYADTDDPKRLIGLDQAIHEAIDFFQRGRPERAEALYRGVIAKRPDMGIAYEQLAFVYWETGRRPQAIATLEQAVERGISDSTIDTKLGMYLTESGRAREGLPRLERAAARPAAGVDALNALAIGYARAGRPDRALAAFERVLALDSRNAMAWQNIGSLQLERGDAHAARASKYEVVAAGGGAGPRRDRPGSVRSPGPPSASSTVGTRSTCRTSSSETAPRGSGRPPPIWAMRSGTRSVAS